MRIESTFWSCLQATLSCAVLSLGLLSACSGEKDAEIPAPTARSSSPVAAPDAEIVAECDQAADGTACGEHGRGTHCLFSACVRNVCGDGISAEDEECDDGNERNGDGCSERCLLESCGNGALDLGEECDDGNNAGKDGCGARCKIERCGNRVIDPGEECDDGNTREDDICSNKCKTQILKMPDAGSVDPGPPSPGPDMDSGASGMDASMDTGAAADTGSATDTGGPVTDAGAPVTGDAGPADLADHRSAKCKSCMEVQDSPCRAYQGSEVDLVASCFNAADAAATKKCAEAFFCTLNARDLCAGDLTRGPVSCYCGLNRTIDDCQKLPSATTGPIGPCVPQWEAATGCAAGDNACVTSKFIVLPNPSAFASFLVGCAVQDCAADCWNPDGGLIQDPDAGTPSDAGAADTGTPSDAGTADAGTPSDAGVAAG